MTKTESKQWESYYESGYAFIDGLKVRMKHFAFFKAQFGQLITLGVLERVTPQQMCEALSVSRAFWAWWRDACVLDTTDLLIPNEILTEVAVSCLKKNGYNGPKKRQQPQRIAKAKVYAVERIGA